MTVTTAPINRYIDRVEPLGRATVARQLTATASSQSQALSAECRRVSIFARTSNIRYVIGIGTQTANASTSHFIAVGERLDLRIQPGSSIGRIRDTAATADGVLEVTELE